MKNILLINKKKDNAVDFQWLIDKLKQKELSHSAAAQKIGVSTSSISNWCSGLYLRGAICDCLTGKGTTNNIVKHIANVLDTSEEEVAYALILYAFDPQTGYFDVVLEDTSSPAGNL